jgi:hypothetical protein
MTCSDKDRGRRKRFRAQNRQLWFGDLGLKITAMVSWVEPQKQADSVCRLRYKTDERASTRDTRRDLAACFTWK